MNQYVCGRFGAQYKATIGADFLSKNAIIDERPVCLQVTVEGEKANFSLLDLGHRRPGALSVTWRLLLSRRRRVRARVRHNADALLRGGATMA